MKNSWSGHLSLTYNQKYKYVLRVTWVGYEFFGTLALGIYLLKVILVLSIRTTRLVHLGVEVRSEELLRQLSYPIKNQLVASKAPY